MNQKLLETIADIAYSAGQQNYYTGNSREDVINFIWWAREFENINANTNWDSTDYILAIETFSNSKLKEVQP